MSGNKCLSELQVALIDRVVVNLDTLSYMGTGSRATHMTSG